MAASYNIVISFYAIKIRDEMLKARMETLQEHNDRIGGLIAELQIQRAHQVSYLTSFFFGAG